MALNHSFADRLRLGIGRFKSVLAELSATQELILFGILVGMAAGAAAYIFDSFIVLAAGQTIARLQNVPWYWRIIGFPLLPALGAGLGAMLIHRLCPAWKGHGADEVLAAIREREGYIQGRVAVAKSIASALTIGFGGSAGREGPVIQIGASVGSWVGRKLKASGHRLKTLTAAGAAAGLAAAFGTPLTAVFFIMEAVLRDFASESFAAVVIASVTAVATARFMLGGGRFMVPLQYDWHGPIDFFLYAALGLLCAPFGMLYMRSLGKMEAWTERHSFRPWLLPALGGVFVGCLALVSPLVMGTGQESINAALQGAISGPQGGSLALAKIVATTATLGTGGSGGALMPSLFIGSMAGAAWGALIHSVLGIHIQYGAFALVGMACVFAAAYQAPVTAMMLALEISQDYDILLPVMFACIVAYLTTRRGRSRPIVEN